MASGIKLPQKGDLNAGVIGSAAREAGSRLLQNKIAVVVIAVIAVLLVIGIWDGLSHWGKVYENVTINGTSVAGMNEEELRNMLEKSYGDRVSNTEITITSGKNSDDEDEIELSDTLDERDILAQLVAAEYSDETTEWSATADSLHASLPYDSVVEQAMAAGRQGGPFGRFGLMLSSVDIPFEVQVDDASVEALAANIDKAMGEIRVDATAIVEDNEARVLPGHDGMMVDRNWLAGKLKEAFLSDEDAVSFVAEVVNAPSRTTMEQAQKACDGINRALQANATFKYRELDWTATGDDISNWTKVTVVKNGDNYELVAGIDRSKAVQEVIEGLGATVSSDDVTVSFEVNEDDVRVHTSGSGTIPEIAPALQSLEDTLYGSNGIAWNGSADMNPVIEIGESDAPESLTFDEALGLGLITVIGEYTTEFTNDPGSENRNHNIKLAADILNNTVATAGGGKWSFNELSGDTNQDPPFASAGSIVNGEYVDSIGGGICQVATTIFNAVYEAGLNVDERWNHSLFIASYPQGRDASVSYPDLNFIWSNQLDSDVLLKMSYTDTSITAQLYSVYTGYHVETEEGTWEDGAKYQTQFETDSELAAGQYYRKQYGEDGSSFSVTRFVYDKNDELIDQNTFTSNYAAKNEIYVIGPGTDTSNFSSGSSSTPSYDTSYNSTYGTGYDSSAYGLTYDSTYGASYDTSGAQSAYLGY